jgi:hypothetical protein
MIRAFSAGPAAVKAMRKSLNKKEVHPVSSLLIGLPQTA